MEGIPKDPAITVKVGHLSPPHLRDEPSPERLLEQPKAIQYHRARLATGKELCGITAVTPKQRDLFEAIKVPVPTRSRLESSSL